MFAIALTPDVTQMLIYGGLMLGGYVLRHVNVLRHKTPSGNHPVLDRLLPIVQEQLNQALEDAARRILQHKP